MCKGTICAVIPAAGRGTRLGLDVPKILAPIGDDCTVWTLLRDGLTGCAGHIHVVVSPASLDVLRSVVTAGPHQDRISVGVQERPLGMGDAIFGASGVWMNFSHLLVVWGDQAGLSSGTLRRAIALHASGSGPRCTLPVVEAERPYVQYVIRNGSLECIRQAREGAAVDDRGFSDVGVFLLEVEGLHDAWRQYAQIAVAGAVTGEVNFLPFLAYLSQQCGWRFETVPVADATEARGINTREDLRFFQERRAALIPAGIRALAPSREAMHPYLEG
jgi:bifunctional UDP-N-acetylglucosamine pyrophosphorylase/glucosamine-1-phosphate N-acetyltransferase